jgi:hypothetical protein
VTAGDPLKLRTPDGTTIRTTLYGLDWPSPMCGKLRLSVNQPLTKADIPVGTEIWKVVWFGTFAIIDDKSLFHL